MQFQRIEDYSSELTQSKRACVRVLRKEMEVSALRDPYPQPDPTPTHTQELVCYPGRDLQPRGIKEKLKSDP